ncbi:PREDICTED: uncharacterized protein LOC108762397 [Trachymyrmex cornetzi]|nr:PREDICTED: uncharacterized protein LOC108762397 [Trachymyrmex cornetzi]
MRTRLHPDAIPTIFFVPECGKENTIDMDIKIEAETNKNIDGEPANKIKQEKNSNMESAETLPIIVDNVDAETVKPSTSKDTKQDMKSSKDSPRKKKLCLKFAKLKAENKTLRETIRRLRLKEKKKSIQTRVINKKL